MAKFNEILSGRFNRGLQKLFSMKGGPPAPQLATEIVPVHRFTEIDHLFIEGWNRFSRFSQVNAVAAQNSLAQLRNPPGSNVIAIVEQLIMNEAATDLLTVELSTGGADLAGAAGPSPLDSRQNTGAVCSLTQGNNQPTVTPIWGGQILANTPYGFIWFREQMVPLLPGAKLRFATNAVNVQLNYYVQWRERFLEDSERT